VAFKVRVFVKYVNALLRLSYTFNVIVFQPLGKRRGVKNYFDEIGLLNTFRFDQ